MEFPASTGPVTFTFEDLAASVAARSDPTVPRPRVKLGHTDPRYNDSNVFDAAPNFGFVDNMHTVGDGHIVAADLVGVPVWLANIMPVAYPSRSIEGWFGYHANSGREYQFIVTALALLGVCFPGVMSLADLPLMYGDEQPSFVTIQEGGE
jgi:hypothetical protein